MGLRSSPIRVSSFESDLVRSAIMSPPRLFLLPFSLLLSFSHCTEYRPRCLVPFFCAPPSFYFTSSLSVLCMLHLYLWVPVFISARLGFAFYDPSLSILRLFSRSFVFFLVRVGQFLLAFQRLVSLLAHD